MLKSLLSSPQVSALEKAISVASLRHKVISDNMANVNTPGFKRSEVVFEEKLQEAMQQQSAAKLPLVLTHERHLPSLHSKPKTNDMELRTVTDNSLRTDGNNVDIDAEMANMAKNSIYYNASIQKLSSYFSNIKSVINDGRR
ncbi:flagellar basal body rod protein FlgB [Acetonema longum]|uniref:Flagellar basal body rod protein FlgB n=1 Tax=Acetonema longum DSM 6540 TaxID=1009370 RepID=F7NL37_9FIRM|nr:flagellar basal body rod protein FlgB [Acetonema longum]EGO63142.1 flagellar basal-body rod protein FlgB [Acetonema longum DSM 6540]